MKLIDNNYIETLIKKYFDKGGEVWTLKDGGLGYGLLMLCGQGLKTTIIKEVYLNEWSSGHTMRMYNKTPIKYEKMLERVLEN